MILYQSVPLTNQRVIDSTAAYFGVHPGSLTKVSRPTKTPALAKHVAAYLLRELFGYSFQTTATALRLKDHTSAMHAVRKIQAMALVQSEISRALFWIIQDVNPAACLGPEGAD